MRYHAVRWLADWVKERDKDTILSLQALYQDPDFRVRYWTDFYLTLNGFKGENRLSFWDRLKSKIKKPRF